MATTKVLIPKLHPSELIFPQPQRASREGLLAWGGDLSAKRLIAAYSQGIFPWFNAGDPLLWWSPDPRLILYPEAIKISVSLKKSLKHFEITYDNAFEAVMRSCMITRLAKGQKSWISEELIAAFCALHGMGYAHSVECYREGELVGGLYGLYLGGVFCGESMFSTQRDASKAALVGLCHKMIAIQGDFIDCQLPTDHLKSLGAIEISRKHFLEALKKSLTCKEREPWSNK